MFFIISLHICHGFVSGAVVVYKKDELKINEIDNKTIKGDTKMAIIRWAPQPSYLTVFDEMDKFFDSFFKRSFDGSLLPFFDWTPAYDVNETEKEYVLRIETPGMNKNDISVNVVDGVLTVSGEKKSKKSENTNLQAWNGTQYGFFSRSFQLGQEVNEKKIKADYKNGILAVSVPKTKPVESKKVQIEVN